MSRWIFYVSPEEPVWGCYLQTGKPCFPLQGIPPHHHQFHHPQALVILGICPPPYIRFPFILSFPLLFFFFFWLHIGRIAPEPFFNQLLLSVNNFISWDIGYSLSHYLYYVIKFHYLLAQNHMAHDSGSCATIRNQNYLSWTECWSTEDLFPSFLTDGK